MTLQTIGVVMPTRNNEATVGAALDSVLSQSRPPDFVVVVDGRSSDRTVSIATKMADMVVHQNGLGLGAARNQGVAYLDTELIAFCDADDQWTTSSLAIKIAHLEANPSCDAVTGQYVLVPEGSSNHSVQSCVENDGQESTTPTAAKARPALTPGGVLIRRRALARAGPFATHLAIATDSDWLVRMRQLGMRLDVIDDLVLVKGRRPASLSRDVTSYRSELLTVARTFVTRSR